MAEEPIFNKQIDTCEADLSLTALSKDNLDPNQILQAGVVEGKERLSTSFSQLGSHSFREFILQGVSSLEVGSEIYVVTKMVSVLDSLSLVMEDAKLSKPSSIDLGYFSALEATIVPLLSHKYMQVRSLAADLMAATRLTQAQCAILKIPANSDRSTYKLTIAKSVEALEDLLNIPELTRLRQMEIRQKLNKLKALVEQGPFSTSSLSCLLQEEPPQLFMNSDENDNAKGRPFKLAKRLKDKVFRIKESK